MSSRIALRSIPLNQLQGNARSLINVEIFGAPAPVGGDPVLVTFVGGYTNITTNALKVPVICNTSNTRNLSYSSTLNSQYNLPITTTKYGNVTATVNISTSLAINSGKSLSFNNAITSQYSLPVNTTRTTSTNNTLLITSFIKGGLTIINRNNANNVLIPSKCNMISATNYSAAHSLVTLVKVNSITGISTASSYLPRTLIRIPSNLYNSYANSVALAANVNVSSNSFQLKLILVD